MNVPKTIPIKRHNIELKIRSIFHDGFDAIYPLNPTRFYMSNPNGSE